MPISMNVSADWIESQDLKEETDNSTSFSKPTALDGDDIFNLIAQCPPLDVNSSYCNFLQSTHFNQTCLIARCGHKISGFVSAYLKPDEPSTLFVWQVAVSPESRGEGLAYRMIQSLLSREALKSSVKRIETTITRDNKASWALFKKLDSHNNHQGCITTFLDKTTHFKGKHDTEYLYRIPLKNRQLKDKETV